jgi:uncharacterized metal-binding protein
MSEECCGLTVPRMILACAGGSNVGQLTNQAAVELTQEGFGKLFCLAAIGAQLIGFVQSAKDVPQLVVIDGCEVACARKVLEEAGVPVRGYLVLTELGIEKNKNLQLVKEEIEQVKAAVKSMAGSAAAGGEAAKPPSGVVTCSCQKT